MAIKCMKKTPTGAILLSRWLSGEKLSLNLGPPCWHSHSCLCVPRANSSQFPDAGTGNAAAMGRHARHGQHNLIWPLASRVWSQSSPEYFKTTQNNSNILPQWPHKINPYFLAQELLFFFFFFLQKIWPLKIWVTGSTKVMHSIAQIKYFLLNFWNGATVCFSGSLPPREAKRVQYKLSLLCPWDRCFQGSPPWAN